MDLKELHRIIRPIPIFTGKKSSLTWLRQYIVSTNTCETQFSVERTGNLQEKPVLIVLCRVLKVHVTDDEPPLKN